MYFTFFNLHLLVVVSWMLFLLQFIKAVEYKKDIEGYIFGLLSLFFMVIVLFIGTKMISMNPAVAKSGGWLHLKLSLVALLMLENIFFLYNFFKKKSVSVKFAEILYWVSYMFFMFILALSMFRPF